MKRFFTSCFGWIARRHAKRKVPPDPKEIGPGVIVTSQHIYQPSNDCRVVLEKNVYKAIKEIVCICPIEVAWYGIVYQNGKDLIITEIFLPRQKASGSTFEVSPESIAVMSSEIIDSVNGREKFSRLAYWGHSHVNYVAIPSGVDDNNMEQYQGRSLMVRGIANKRGEMRFDLFFFLAGKTYLDVPWTVAENEGNWDFGDVASQLRENVFNYHGEPIIQ